MEGNGIDPELIFGFQKRQLAVQSHSYNLNDAVFCELFPEIVKVRASQVYAVPVANVEFARAQVSNEVCVNNL